MINSNKCCNEREGRCMCSRGNKYINDYNRSISGPPGHNGWTPLYIDHVYGDKIVRELRDYFGGTGEKPFKFIGQYLKNNGYTTNINEASNYKGIKGDDGSSSTYNLQEVTNVGNVTTLNIVADSPPVSLSHLTNKRYVDNAISNIPLPDLTPYQLKFEKGNPNGYPGLDSDGKILINQLPDSILGNVRFGGTYDGLTIEANASTVPELEGQPLPLPDNYSGVYFITSQDFINSGINYVNGDWIISTGLKWEKIANSDAVTTVFGRNGNILANESDYEIFYPKLSTIYQNPSWIGTLDWSKITNKPIIEIPTLSEVLTKGNSAGSKIINLSDPTDINDATNKGYVDNGDILIYSNSGTNRNIMERRYVANFSGTRSVLLLSSGVQSSGVGSIYIGSGAGHGTGEVNSSIYLGNQAGIRALGTSFSNFFGVASGRDAENANSSNFFGSNAGAEAYNSNNSNFFGSGSGVRASNAPYSNLFGNRAGQSFTGNSIGGNNIIIGTDITLPNGVNNSINIGGVIFGTGTYSNYGGNPRITPSPIGRVGIGVVSPSNTLEVNGTAGYTSDVSSTYTARSLVDKGYVDALISNIPTETPTLQQVLAKGNSAGNRITNLTAPSGDLDAANKKYVDDNSPIIATSSSFTLSGYNFRARPTANYGTTGRNAVDFSLSNSTSTTRGATGRNSFATGTNTTSSGISSAAFGQNTVASANASLALGSNSKANGLYSFAGGLNSQANGDQSFAFNGVANAFGSVSIGITPNPIVMTPESTRVEGSPIFIVGSGKGGALQNAYTLYNDGRSEQIKDMEVTEIGQGIVLKSPDGSRHRITVSDTGTLTTIPL